jgi:uncharacterized membrane protein YsdA (DUF1294 family)
MIAAVASYLILLNLITYYAFAADKKQAIHRERRIPESRLLLLVFAGGSFGGWRAMRDYHHKVKKWRFRNGVRFALLLHVITALILFLRSHAMMPT